MTTPIPAGWKPISSAPKDGTPVLLFARHIDAEASTRVVGWFNDDYGWIAQSYIGQPVARLIPSQWAELLPFPGSPASVAPGDAQDERQEWMTCESRRPWVTNSLKASAEKLRNKERRCRRAYTQDFYGVPARYVADVYAEAAAVFEAKLAALAAQVPHKGGEA